MSKNVKMAYDQEKLARDWEKRQLRRFYRQAEAPIPTADPETGELNIQTKQDLDLELGRLCYPNPMNSLEKIILNGEVKNTLENGMNKLRLKDFLNEDWDMKSIEPMENKNIFNFYGPPGTGKTISAKAISLILNKPLFIVDYAQMESKWVGATEKNISEIFKIAREHEALILFDEADTLASRRIEEATSQSRHINSARNVFMQELDRFDGIVILTTNLFQNFDPALLRRVNQHIKFELPTEDMRIKIIQGHIPPSVPREEGFSIEALAVETLGFSGGDIKNMTREAMVSAASDALNSGDVKRAVLTMSHIRNEIKKIRSSKDNHSGEAERKTIGLAVK